MCWRLSSLSALLHLRISDWIHWYFAEHAIDMHICCLSLGRFGVRLWFNDGVDDFVADELSLTASSCVGMHLKLWLYWVENFGCLRCNGIMMPNNSPNAFIIGKMHRSVLCPLAAMPTMAAILFFCANTLLYSEGKWKRAQQKKNSRLLPSMVKLVGAAAAVLQFDCRRTKQQIIKLFEICTKKKKKLNLNVSLTK